MGSVKIVQQKSFMAFSLSDLDGLCNEFRKANWKFSFKGTTLLRNDDSWTATIFWEEYTSQVV